MSFFFFFSFQEAGIKTDEGRKEPFTELNYILDCLKQKNLEPALEWAMKHREELIAQVCYNIISDSKKIFNIQNKRFIFRTLR